MFKSDVQQRTFNNFICCWSEVICYQVHNFPQCLEVICVGMGRFPFGFVLFHRKTKQKGGISQRTTCRPPSSKSHHIVFLVQKDAQCFETFVNTMQFDCIHNPREHVALQDRAQKEYKFKVQVIIQKIYIQYCQNHQGFF